MDLKSLNNTKLLSELDGAFNITKLPSKFWFSARSSVPRPSSKTYSELNTKFADFHCVAVRRMNGRLQYNIVDCKLREKLPFACIHQPFTLLTSFMFSKTWNKFSRNSACYYIDDKEKTWGEANESCHAIPTKSMLLDSIKDLYEYSVFKLFLRMITPVLEGSSWWTSLFQEENTLKWSSSPENLVTFVDWERHTNFDMKRSGGILIQTENNILWSLRKPSSKESSICEMRTCAENITSYVYVEDKTAFAAKEDSDDIHHAKLKCIPFGWFLSDSVTWFKDGVTLSSGSSDHFLNVTMNVPFEPKNILQFQGYYWCSVDINVPYIQIYSHKILLRSPGLHTFALYMKSEIEITNCTHSLLYKLPYIDKLNEHLKELYPVESWYALKDVRCTSSKMYIFEHVHISKKSGDEEKLRKDFEELIENNGEIAGILNNLRTSKDNTFFRSTVVCPREESNYKGHILTWPETPIGESTLPEQLCLTDKGDALERQCLGDFNRGAHWSLVLKTCANVQSEVTETLYHLSKKNISEENVLNSTETMERLTANSEGINTADVKFISQILENVAQVPTIESEVLEPIVNTVDTVINTISTSDKKYSLTRESTRVLCSVENILSNAETSGQVIKAARENIAVTALPLNSTNISAPVVGFLENWGSNITTIVNDSIRSSDAWFEQHGTFEAAVFVPGNLLSQNLSDVATNIAMGIRKNIHFIKDAEVISPVIDIAIGKESICNLDPPVEMVFRIPKNSFGSKRPWGCVFWDKRLNQPTDWQKRKKYPAGGWSYQGCNSVYINVTHVRCFCNHLTSFAVVMRLNPEHKMTTIHEDVLSIITYIGCCLSILGLGIIILTFVLFKKWRSDVRHKVLFNFSLALVSFLTIFLIGIEKIQWKYGCLVIAVLLHYFMLASFTWMLVEAFIHYLNLVKVIGTYIPNFIQKAMLFAWGLPLLMVVIILAVNPALYSGAREHQHCWLSDKVFYFAVAAPVVLMLLINYVTFMIILYSNTCGRTKMLRTNQSERREMIIRARAVFCASVLLGLSWVFGCLADIKGAEVICEYLFAVTTTLQGFLMSIFFVFRRKNTRDLWMNIMKRRFESETNQKTSSNK